MREGGGIRMPKKKRKVSTAHAFSRSFKNDWQLWVLLLPAIAFFIVFSYLPFYGIQIAFKDYKPVLGILGSSWVGFKNFIDFFHSYYFSRLLTNTFLLNFFGLLWGFPLPIILALLVNQLAGRFKKFTQTVIYTPHFISTVVIAGMLYLFLSPTSGMINNLITALGGKPINFMIQASWFRTLFISTDVWQHAGWNTILYIAALTAIDPGLYEAATMDGATKWQKIIRIDIPHLMPIAVLVLILNSGNLLVSNTDKAFLLQTSGNLQTSDIIGIYVYKFGLGKAQFSYTTAIGLFTNVINFAMVMLVNRVSKWFGGGGLF